MYTDGERTADAHGISHEPVFYMIVHKGMGSGNRCGHSSTPGPRSRLPDDDGGLEAAVRNVVAFDGFERQQFGAGRERDGAVDRPLPEAVGEGAVEVTTSPELLPLEPVERHDVPYGRLEASIVVWEP